MEIFIFSGLQRENHGNKGGAALDYDWKSMDYGFGSRLNVSLGQKMS